MKDLIKSVIEHAILGLENISPDSVYGCDLHNELFNQYSFIKDHAKAEKWLIDNVGIFQAIEDIKNYESENFGEVNTDFSSSEKVCNMFTYIEGEKVLAESQTLQDSWDSYLTAENIDVIKSELKNLLK